MKALKLLFLLFAVICMVLTCGKTDRNLKGDNLKKGKVKMVTLPFEADFTGTYIYVGPDTLPDHKCGEPLSAWRAIVDCKGTGVPIGELTAHFDFCGDAESHYGNNHAYMFAGGDTLFVACAGQVIDGRLEDHPACVTSYWRDPFTILGGTGQYYGASGSGMTDDYNSDLDPFSHHHWTGTITLVKGRPH